MPVPLLGWIGASVAGAFVGGSASAAFQYVVGSVVNPFELLKAQEEMAARPANLPSWGEALGARLRGLISPETFFQAVKSVGAWGPSDEPWRLELWRGVQAAARTVPGVSDIIAMYLKGVITYEEYCKKMKRAGANVKDWSEAVRTANGVPTLYEAQALFYRGLISELQFKELVRRNGFADPRLVDLFEKFGRPLPPPTDTIRYAVREAFDEEAAKPSGLDLDAEFPEAFGDVCEALGLRDAVYKLNDGTQREIDIAKMEWRAHWQLPSAGQMYTFLHLFRPNRIGRYQRTLPPPLGDKLKAFTAADLDRGLKANDYAPTWRPLLAAASFLPMRRVDSARLFNARIWSKSDLTEAFLDGGLVVDDAKALADWSEQQRDYGPFLSAAKQSGTVALQGYAEGTLTKAQTAIVLKRGYLLNPEEAQKFNEKLPPAQAAEALADPRVNLRIMTVDQQLTNKAARIGVGTVQARVYGGMATLAEAERELSSIGLTKERVTHWTNIWRVKLSGPRRTFALRELQRLYREGAISAGELIRRAGVLGYGAADLEVLARSAAIFQAEKNAKMEEQERRRQKAAQREQEQQAEKERKAVAWKSSPNQLGEWFKTREISEAVYRRLLQLDNFKADEIDLLVQDNAP